MKKIISASFIFLFFLFAQVDAKVFENNYDKLPSKNVFSATADKNRKEILKFLKNANKIANKKDIEGIKKIYDKNYVSSDGFDYETYIKLTEETFKSYPNIKYKTKVDNLVITGDYAIVKMSDYTTARLVSTNVSEEKYGSLESICKYTSYLVKRDDGWKILYDFVEFEESALKYGDAKKIKIRLETPPFIKENENYELALTVDYPEDTFAMASIGNEEIVYPDVLPKESFRKIKSNIPLERIVHANKNGHNEYAVASIGLTRVVVKEDKEASLMNFAFKMSGMAFIMRRVNLLDGRINLRFEKE